ncbi:PREDICTED: uncharacterized protein LOC109238449 [Nicotiana attenuata]|uniref:Uncharacterized protein n=1 Tax=Nicotiana attenuata TaxID=49451 RepID=A0A314LC10_NICAT|nr:PREDICTED: uncharacterized protein LOC109238449 [Nicotiana attenuata]OIT39175.1 hypothetical protein A4A49_13367 [Nicotiana attenuata]
MAYTLPNLSTNLLHSKDKLPVVHHHHHHLSPLSSASSSDLLLDIPLLSAAARVVQVNRAPPTLQKERNNDHNNDDFYVNLGLAVRTLREDLPLIFTKDLNYDIYRDDITFVDPLNTFNGIERYKLIFWALRFHGRILFREISLKVMRIWQPSENVILIRWNLTGIPRVPWEAKGQFQGTSTYKLDRTGKIYEHKVDNLALNFPQPLRPVSPSVLDLVTATPNPTFSLDSHSPSSSWLLFYRSVKETLDRQSPLIAQDCLLTCP